MLYGLGMRLVFSVISTVCLPTLYFLLLITFSKNLHDWSRKRPSQSFTIGTLCLYSFFCSSLGASYWEKCGLKVPTLCTMVSPFPPLSTPLVTQPTIMHAIYNFIGHGRKCLVTQEMELKPPDIFRMDSWAWVQSANKKLEKVGHFSNSSWIWWPCVQSECTMLEYWLTILEKW